jgi:hypothetical protein
MALFMFTSSRVESLLPLGLQVRVVLRVPSPCFLSASCLQCKRLLLRCPFRIFHVSSYLRVLPFFLEIYATFSFSVLPYYVKDQVLQPYKHAKLYHSYLSLYTFEVDAEKSYSELDGIKHTSNLFCPSFLHECNFDF